MKNNIFKITLGNLHRLNIVIKWFTFPVAEGAKTVNNWLIPFGLAVVSGNSEHVTRNANKIIECLVINFIVVPGMRNSNGHMAITDFRQSRTN